MIQYRGGSNTNERLARPDVFSSSRGRFSETCELLSQPSHLPLSCSAQPRPAILSMLSPGSGAIPSGCQRTGSDLRSASQGIIRRIGNMIAVHIKEPSASITVLGMPSGRHTILVTQPMHLPGSSMLSLVVSPPDSVSPLPGAAGEVANMHGYGGDYPSTGSIVRSEIAA